MISEGSCGTEGWSNDAENSALPSNKFQTKVVILRTLNRFASGLEKERKKTIFYI